YQDNQFMSNNLLIEMLDKSRAETEVAFASLDPNRIIYQEGQWRIKDIIAHLTVYEQAAINALQAYQAQSQFVIQESRDTYNTQEVERRRNFTSERVWQEWGEIRERLKITLNNLP